MSREEANRLSSLQREQNRKNGKDGRSNNLAKLKSMFPVNILQFVPEICFSFLFACFIYFIFFSNLKIKE